MIAHTYDVLSYGTMGMDRIIRVPHLPQADRSTHSSDENLHLGGKATNAASVLAYWGVTVAVCGTTIGDDFIGNALFEALREHPGISTEFLSRQQGLASMFCYVFVAQSGERAIVGMNADNNPPTPPTVEMIERCSVLTLDLYGGDERVEAARIARSMVKPVIIGDLREPEHPVLPYTDIAISSGAELRMQGFDPVDFAIHVMESGTKSVIITNGAMPVLVFDSDGSTWEVMPPKVTIVNTTGAGDAFRAGVVYGVLNRLSLIESVALGAAVGSLIAAALGASTRIPKLDIVMNLADGLQRNKSSWR